MHVIRQLVSESSGLESGMIHFTYDTALMQTAGNFGIPSREFCGDSPVTVSAERMGDRDMVFIITFDITQQAANGLLADENARDIARAVGMAIDGMVEHKDVAIEVQFAFAHCGHGRY